MLNSAPDDPRERQETRETLMSVFSASIMPGTVNYTPNGRNLIGRVTIKEPPDEVITINQ